jgi:predicted ATPase/DNA-binding NarL/FixJ family response regulator
MDIRYDSPRQLIGREREASDVVRLVGTTRLLTLTGPGGVGKTALALTTADLLAPVFPAGVVFVDLSPVRDPALLMSTIAQALGIAPTRDDQLHAQLVAQLHGRELLVILDNCEQLIAGAPLIGALLAGAPALKLLCTSRAALRIQGEQEYPLAPLPVPQQAAPPTEIAATPAAQLLLKRARAARADFGLTDANAATIGAICRRLDGLPLALELAAARLRVLTPQDLLARLDRRLPLLTGGLRDAPDRQRTLRAAIAWSYDLLPDEAQERFRRLAVFRGGATPTAVAAIWGIAETDPDLIDALTGLLDQSLLIRQSDEAHERIRLLETVREYAEEQLEASGGAPDVRTRHAHFYATLAEAAEPELTGAAQADWLERLDVEQANLAGAVDWLLDPHYGSADDALRLGIALARFWWIKNRLIEGRGTLERILAATRQSGVAATIGQATLLQWAATMAWGQADYAAAQERYEEGLALCRALGDPQATARALKGLGTLAREQGRTLEARRLFEEGLALMRAAHDDWGVTLILSHLGMTVETLGRYAEARALQEECLALSEALGDSWSVAYALKDLGHLALQEGAIATARSQVEAAIAGFERLGDTQGLAYALMTLGDIALSAGNAADAAAHYARMLTVLEELGDRRGVALARCGLADAALAAGAYGAAQEHLVASLANQHAQRNPITLPRGLETAARLAAAVHEPERAISLYAAAQNIRASMSIPIPAAQQPALAAMTAQVEQLLAAEAFAAAQDRGRALSAIEAIALAGRPRAPKHLAATAPALEAIPPRAAADGAETLTNREHEVLALLAQGKSNSAIAAELRMSPHTVHSHVRTIFGKLEVTTRAAATRVALERGLLTMGE